MVENSEIQSHDDRDDGAAREKQSHFAKVTGKLKRAFKKYGWKLGLLIVIGYLIRDTVLYIILPYLIARNLITG